MSESLAPYTGKTAAPAPDAAPPEAPRVPWRRITLVHLLAGGVMGFVVPTLFFLGSNLLTANVLGYLPILLISAIVVALIGSGPTLLAAWIVWLVVSRARRGLGRELVAVAAGALVGSLPVSLLLGGFLNSWEPGLLGVLFFGVPSAIGFAIWVLVAWRRAPIQPEHSLN
jgi:hypothetical protein